METSLVYEVLVCSFFALYGSAARTLADNRDTGKTGWALVWLLSANAVISSFCGLMAVPVAQLLQLNGGWRLFLAGMAGYMGQGFLTSLETLVQRRIGSDDGNRLD